MLIFLNPDCEIEKLRTLLNFNLIAYLQVIYLIFINKL